MATGFCLSIGLNSINPGHYQGSSGKLVPCEGDARDMAILAAAVGLQTKVLLTEKATSSAVLETLLDQSKRLSASDLMVVYYSGHGGQLRDVSGDEEGDKLDETLCLFDRMLIDDELFAMWAKFKPGTRIFMLADSCHSGSIAKALEKEERYSSMSYADISVPGFKATSEPTFKAIDFTLSWQTYIAHQQMYDSLGYVAANADVKASVIQISACQDKELAIAGVGTNSLFTAMLKHLWANGTYPQQRGYQRFRDDLANLTSPNQEPNFLTFGAPNAMFEAQRPFTI